jgi:hypothetical protein
VFNPFPLAGASAPIATSGPNVFSPSPLTPVVQPVPPTGVGVFNVFPLSGASLPLSTVGGTVPNPNPAPAAAGVFASQSNGPGAAAPVTANPSATSTVASTGITIPNATNIFVVTVPSNQISLALIDPQAGSQTSTQAHLVNPEPTALVLFATGMGWLAWLKRKNPRRS